MNRSTNQSPLALIIEEATDLAARALGCCMVQMIDACVPARFTTSVKGRIALELMSSVDAHVARPNSAVKH
jgi:hypothetical protein